METDLFPSSEGINGINLANYFPNRRSYNSVVYFHKRFLPDVKEERKKEIKKDSKIDSDKKKKKKCDNNAQHDKSQQFNSEMMNRRSYKYETVETAPCNNSVLDQTIRFAKNLAPLVIPKESQPVFYTIKSSKKHKKRDKNRESSNEQNLTYNKNKFKKCYTKNTGTNHKDSLRDSIEPSLQNTLDDIHININQSRSFSESTEIKFHKKAQNHVKVTNESSQKFHISNSFEALATESLVDVNKIKIHLMTDADKNQFCDSIQNPIKNAIRDYIVQLNYTTNSDLNTDLKKVQNIAISNSQKLDDILQKLTSIQSKIDVHATQTTEFAVPRVPSASKASRLEEIGQDIIEVKEQCTSDEDFSEEYNKLLKKRRNKGSKTNVVTLDLEVKDEDKNKDSLGCGEEVPGPVKVTSSNGQLGAKPDRPNRIPARFCWTDADRKK